MTRLLFLDYDDTLLSQPHHAVMLACRLLGKACPSAEEFRTRKSIHFYEAFPSVFRNAKEMWAVGLLAVPLGYFRSQTPLRYSVPKMGEVLRDQRSYVLSKNPPAFTPWRVRRLRSLFGVNIRDRYIACGPLLKRGPSKIEIIKSIAAYHQVNLKDCLLIDDSDETVSEAAKAGIACALVDSAWNAGCDLPNSALRIATNEIPDLAKKHLGAHQLEGDQVFLAAPMGPWGTAKIFWSRLVRGVVYGERIFRKSTTHSLARSHFTSPLFSDPHYEANHQLSELLSTPEKLYGARLIGPDGREKFAMLPVHAQETAAAAAPEDKVRLFKIACRQALEYRGIRLVRQSLYLFTALDREKERQRILASSRVRQTVESYAEAHKTSKDDAWQKARSYAREIVAGRSYLGCWITMTAFNLLIATFRSLSINNREAVEEFEKDHFVIFAAVHRSYLDSAILLACIANFTNSFPFVAAADKMRRVWSGRLGYIAGAFFMQRKFVNAIYAAILTEHIGAMQAPGNCLEIFLEGQRSRSGLTLPPKKGIASILWNNIDKHDARKQTVIIPVAFTYNKLPESELLLSEGHEERKKNGVAALREIADMSIRARARKSRLEKLRAFVRRIATAPVSECYMSYGQPIVLRRTMDGNEELEQHLHRTMRRINAVTQALPSSILSLALLNARDHHLRADDAAGFLDLAKAILPAYGNHEQTHPHLYSSDTTSQLEQFVKLPFVNRKFKRKRMDERHIIALSELDVERASYYMNNILHFFVLPALLASVLVESRIGRIEELHRFLDHMFAKLSNKYFLPEVEPRKFIDEMLGLFQRQKYLRISNDTYAVSAENEESQSLMLLARLGRSFVKDDLSEVFGAFRRSYQRFDVSLQAQLTKVKREAQNGATINAMDQTHFFLTGDDTPQVGDGILFLPEGISCELAGTVTKQEIDGALVAAEDGWLDSLAQQKGSSVQSLSGKYSYQRELNTPARVESISTSGALVVTDESLKQGDVVSASIELGSTTLRIEGQVMRTSAAGAGVKFNSLSMEQEAKLLVFLANATDLAQGTRGNA